jgi:penicillin-insensitive murein endopeptidase
LPAKPIFCESSPVGYFRARLSTIIANEAQFESIALLLSWWRHQGFAARWMRSFTFLFLSFLPICLLGMESTCYGTTSNGRLANGVQLPGSGPNFISYGSIPELTGRTFVHSSVRDVIVAAYRILETDQPGKVFKYAESGAQGGGRFPPHKTHQNGLSVDFMVPVLDGRGKSVHLPTHALNRYGYDLEFDDRGRYAEYQIDYEALGAHMVALHKAARSHGMGIWRVLFDPRLQSYLYATRYGEYIRSNIEIPAKRSWVRHDEHIHVDFIVECRPM